MKKTIINRNWYFKFGENKGDEINIKLNEYSLIGLPHSFGIPYYGENDFYVGYGTYYKEFNCNCDIQNSCILLEFGAIFQIAEIYLNGKYIQSHEGGYTAFTVDITNYIKQGKNTLFVRVNNIWKATLAPRAGEHIFNGGIYRDVYLIVYPKTHIDWYGVRVSSSKISDNEYELNIETKCVNAEGKILLSEVIDADGNIVCSSDCKIINNKALQKVKIENPTLWDIDNPYLYSLKTTLEDDRLLTPFGIRIIEWTKDNGFFLNGKHLLLEGANVHQDHGGWGDAVTHSGIKRDITLMKNCGFNFIRGSHYPHHTEFAKECDRQGMLFLSENVFWGIGGFGSDGFWKSSAMPVKKEHYKAFEESLRQQLSEMIRVNYNSPSIICWSMGNEVFFCNKKKVFFEKGELKTGFENALKFNWTDKNYSVELYDFSDCLKMFYDTDTKRVDFALSDKNILYYNNGKKIEIFREQINEKYCEIKKSHRKKMQYDKYFYKIFCKKLNYTLKINKEIFNKYRDAVLIIDAPCDMAHMYCSGNIVADYININNTWQIGLSRFKDDILNDATFEIRTCAIKRYQKTYFNSEIHMNDASIKLNRIYGYK